MTLAPRSKRAIPFVLSPDLPGGHRHNYHAFVSSSKGESPPSSVQVKGRFDNVRKLILRATQKLQSLQPEHHHFETEDDLYEPSLDKFSPTDGVDEDDRVVIGQGAYGTVSVVNRNPNHQGKQSLIDDKTKVWPLLSSPTSPLGTEVGEEKLWRVDDGCSNKTLMVAVKIFRRRPSQDSSSYSRRVQREFDMAKKLQHPNVIETFELVGTGSGDGHQGSQSGTTDNSLLSQVMEYCDAGDLHQLIRSRAPAVLEIAEADCLFVQLMAGVKYLHETAGIAHCDIKPENLLLTRDGRLKIADFGCSQRCRAEADGAVLPVSAAGGSERYRTPEQHVGGELDGPAIDVWACGVTYMVMRLGRRLWPAAKADDEYYLMYLQGRREAAGYLPIEVLKPVECRNIVYCMLDPVAKRRIKASQLLRTEWARTIQVCGVGDTKVH